MVGTGRDRDDQLLGRLDPFHQYLAAEIVKAREKPRQEIARGLVGDDLLKPGCVELDDIRPDQPQPGRRRMARFFMPGRQISEPRSRPPVDRHVTGIGLDAFQPCRNRGK